MKTNQKLTIIILFGLSVAATALAEQNHDELKSRLLAQAQSLHPDDYAFTRTTRVEQKLSGNIEKHVNVEKFDPTKPIDARWTLVSVDGTSPAPDALKNYLAGSAKRRVPGYYRLAGYLGAPATVSKDSGGRTVFHFGALPKDTVRVLDSDVSHNTSGDVSVGEANGVPFVDQVTFVVRPMRIKLLIKLDRFESKARYHLGPDGKPVLIEQTSDMSGSGMGKEGQGHTVTTYSDYRAITKSR